MLTKEQFIEIIDQHQNQTSTIKKFEELGFEIWDSSVIEFGFMMFDHLISSNFSTEGVDWINWWIYERPILNINQPLAFNKDCSEIPTETIEDLWDIVEKYRI